MKSDDLELYRDFMKDKLRLSLDFSKTDQRRGVEMPPIQKPYPEDAKIIPLAKRSKWKNPRPVSFEEAVANRRSHRNFSARALELDELAFLLWATQGLRESLNDRTVFRTVPSAGNRHAFESYLLIRAVKGLESGLYRYLPLENALLFKGRVDGLDDKITRATLGQSFAAEGAVVFVWASIPYRMEWRYGLAAHRVILMDVGHVCQNLYLACEAINAGTCAVAAYDQTAMDALIGLDGEEEFVVYLAPLGKLS